MATASSFLAQHICTKSAATIEAKAGVPMLASVTYCPPVYSILTSTSAQGPSLTGGKGKRAIPGLLHEAPDAVLLTQLVWASQVLIHRLEA